MRASDVGVHDSIQAYFAGLRAVLDALRADEIEPVIKRLERARDEGKQVFIAGNGGSAATASHMACDLGKTVLGQAGAADRRRFRVIALTDNVPLLTAWGNDASYDTIFAEQLRNLANPGDLLIVITASGNSPNIAEAVKTARELEVTTIGLLGFDGGIVRAALNHAIVVPSDSYGYVEDAHMVLNHLITAYFREACE